MDFSTLPTSKLLTMLILVFGSATFLVLERFFAYQKGQFGGWRHVRRNILVAAVNFIFLSFASAAVYKTAEFAELRNLGANGLLNIGKTPLGESSWSILSVSTVTAVVLFLVYDFLNYLIHRSLHRNRYLWSIHRVHHADLYIDVTSAFYFHPFEAFYRGLLQCLAVIVLGVPLVVLAAYQSWSVFALLLAHANLRLPARVDRAFRKILVLPTTHRVHHSVLKEEHDSNFGIGFQIWDWIFGTLTVADTENQRRIGLADYPRQLTALESLSDPLR
jgi:sterol desaturase/sphingolipid hydroxylase (fatty acid hydroxylase superfamily)